MSVILPSLFNTHPRLTPCNRDMYATAIPEPGTLALLGIALAALAVFRRRH